ncbi:MAG: hypothetical protein LBV17_03715 [Treponema sp.]|nr:hypothetical protein [Treponema sp.]
MAFNKKLVFFTCLFLLALNAYPQASVTITEYGTYFIDNGIVKKIPVADDVGGGEFWGKYIILDDDDFSFIYFYNMENGALSDLIRRGRNSVDGFFPIKRKGNPNLLFYYCGAEYELNPVTLKTIRTRVYTSDENVYDSYDLDDPKVLDELFHWTPWQGDIQWKRDPKSPYINYYYGDNFYLKVTLSNKLNPKNNTYICGGVDNRFVFSIHDKYWDGR